MDRARPAQAAAAATLMLSAWRLGCGTSYLSHFFLHRLAPLASMACLVLLVSEFASLDPMSNVSSWPHHPTVSASHLAPTPLLDPVLTISRVRLPPSSRILFPWPVRLDTHLFRKAGSMLFQGSSDSFPPSTTGTLSAKLTLPFTLLPLYFIQTQTPPRLTDPTSFLHICLPHFHLHHVTPSLPGGLGTTPNAWYSELLLLPCKSALLPTPLLLRKVTTTSQA